MWGLMLCLGPSSVFAIEPPAAVLSGLVSEDFKEREKAQKDLFEWSRVNLESAAGVLVKLSSESGEPEIRQRCLAVLKDLANDEFQKTGEGYVGIMMKDEIAQVPGDEVQRGVIRVGEVVEGTAGHEAGLQANDLIVGVDEDVWRGGPASLMFSAKIRKLKPGSKVTLKVLRGEKIEDLVITLGRRPLGADIQFFGQPKAAEAAEKAARNEHFRQWMAELNRKLRSRQ